MSDVCGGTHTGVPAEIGAPEANRLLRNQATLSRLFRRAGSNRSSADGGVMNGERLIRNILRARFDPGIGKLVAHRAHDFREHHSQIGFEPIFPRGMAVGCKIEQRLANTPEIAGQIIDRVVDEIFFRAFVRLRGAQSNSLGQFALKLKPTSLEIRIDEWIVESESIAREVAGLRRDYVATRVGRM